MDKKCYQAVSREIYYFKLFPTKTAIKQTRGSMKISGSKRFTFHYDFGRVVLRQQFNKSSEEHDA